MRGIYIGFMLLTSLLFIVPVSMINSVVADETAPSGETIIGDSVVLDAPYAYLKVYPHTASDGIRQTQYCDFTWKKPSSSVDFAFIFPMQLMGYKDVFVWKNISHMVSVPVINTLSDSFTIKHIVSYTVLPVTPSSVDFGDIPSNKYYYVAVRNNSVWHNVTIGFDSFTWINSSHTGGVFTYSYSALTGYTFVEKYFFDWLSIKNLFSMEQVGDSFYYYFKGISVVQGASYHLKWVYDLPINAKGKWSLMVKLSSDTLQDAFSSSRYVMLDPWYNTAWLYSKRIVIDHTNVEVNLYNYPVYFNCSSGDFVHAQSDGDDFMFIAVGNTTKYNHQIENFSSNRLIAWVNITTLSSSVDTVLYLYYGNAVCSSQANNASTWNSTYVMVYHMKDKTSTTVGDSTINAMTMDKQSAGHPVQKKARADSGEYFALTTDYLSTSAKYMPLGMKSVEIWWHCNGSTFKEIYDSAGGITSTYGLNIYLGPSTTNRFWAIASKGTSGTANFMITAVGNFSNNKWHYGMLTWDGTITANRVKLYCDKIMNTTTALATESSSSTYNDFFGCLATSKNYQVYGWLDEIRISNCNRSRGYFNTTKNCINSSTTFLSVGPESLLDNVAISAMYPVDASITQIPRPWLSVTVYDTYGTHRMNLTFGTNFSGSWRVLGTNLTRTNGTYHQYMVNLTQANKKMWWRVNVSDGHSHYVNKTYSFTTGLCNLSTSISETKTNCTGSTSAAYVPSTGFAISAVYLSKLFDYSALINTSGTHQKAWDSSVGAFKVWANYTTKLYDYATIVNSSGTHQKAYYSVLGAFKVWANYTTKLYDYSTITNASGSHQKAWYPALGAFKTWANYSSKVYDYKNFVNCSGTLQKAWYPALGMFKVWGNVTGSTTPFTYHNNTHNLTGLKQLKLFGTGYHLYDNQSGVTTPFTYHNNTVNVSSVKQLKLFGTGYHLWDNSSSGVMSYTNFINCSGTLQKAWYSSLGKFKVWANVTGTTTPISITDTKTNVYGSCTSVLGAGGYTVTSVHNSSITPKNHAVNSTLVHQYYWVGNTWLDYANSTGTGGGTSLGIKLFQNIINATGTHEYKSNGTSYLVWANYTGTGNGTSSIVYVFLKDIHNNLIVVGITCGLIFGFIVGLIVYIKRRKGDENV